MLTKNEAIHKALDVIQWMSGSGDFAPGGQAHEGWQKIQNELADINSALDSNREPNMNVKGLSMPQLKSRLSDLNEWIARSPGGAALTEMDEERHEIEREIRLRGLPRLEARVVPYSSVVGSSIMLTDPGTGRQIATMPLLNVQSENHRGNSEKLAERVARAINNGFQAELVIAEMKRTGKLDAWIAGLAQARARQEGAQA